MLRAAPSLTTIERLTPAVLHAAAQWAAAQHIPLAEANHYEPGSDLWAQFNQAYGAYAATAVVQQRARRALQAQGLEQEAA